MTEFDRDQVISDIQWNQLSPTSPASDPELHSAFASFLERLSDDDHQRVRDLNPLLLGLGAGDSGLLRLAAWWLPHESGAIERIGGQLTRSERCFIVHGTPEGSCPGKSA